jgi:hypothetical protein
MVFAPNGDLFVSQTGANAISVFRDTNKDGLPDERQTFCPGTAAAWPWWRAAWRRWASARKHGPNGFPLRDGI